MSGADVCHRVRVSGPGAQTSGMDACRRVRVSGMDVYPETLKPLKPLKPYGHGCHAFAYDSVTYTVLLYLSV
eukprot:2634834-Pyramimonas_sp.AAC.1